MIALLSVYPGSPAHTVVGIILKSTEGAGSHELDPFECCITLELVSYPRRDTRTIACHGHHLLYPVRYGVILADTCPARELSIGHVG